MELLNLSTPSPELINFLTNKKKEANLIPQSEYGIPNGARNDTLTSIAGFLRSKGQDEEAIYQSLLNVKCQEPLDPSEIRAIAKSVAKYPSGSEKCPVNWIENWIIENHVTVKLSGLFEKLGTTTQVDIIKDQIFIESKKTKTKGVTQALINSFLSIWMDEAKIKAFKDLSEALKFTGKNNELKKFVKAITGEEKEIDIAVLTHWIANIKRKLMFQRVNNHLMIIIVGKTGSGKSVAIHNLISPISDLMLESDLAMVNDSRNDHNYISKAVIFFDELSRAKATDISSLKQKITAPSIEFRKLGTNSNILGFNLSSFIGASNYDVKDAIYDPTSARRYYQLNSLDKCDWDLINQINYSMLWKGIDENSEVDHLENIKVELKKEQERIRALDSVEEWLMEEDLHPTTEDYAYYTIPRIYKAYSIWMSEQSRGRYVHTKPKFSRMLTQLTTPSKVIKGKRRYRLNRKFTDIYFNINDDGKYEPWKTRELSDPESIITETTENTVKTKKIGGLYEIDYNHK